MAVYTIAAHDALNGSVRRDYRPDRKSAVWEAERLFNRSDYLWVDVILKDRAGRIRHVHHIEREPTNAERAAIAQRYSTGA